MKRLIGTWQEKAALKLKQPWQEVLPRLSSEPAPGTEQPHSGLLWLLPSTASAWQGWQDLQTHD